MYKILNKVNNPDDLKNLSIKELTVLAGDVRNACLQRVSEGGGHVGSNLGIVELTIALHYVFDFKTDKLVLDVSHQCYPHKILTERKSGFIESDKIHTITGYLSPKESPYDTFQIGHTSTSISLATGLATARDLNNETHNIVAVIGDGSLSGGEAFEGLNNAGNLKSNFIIVVNDNDMSIAENQGSLYQNLRELKNTHGVCSGNFFKTLGFDYLFVEDGNNIQTLIDVFLSVKDIDHPIVVHVNTIKGNGYDLASKNKELWHWRNPFDVKTGELKTKSDACDYPTLTREYLLNKAEKDKDVVVVTAATPGICGFDQNFRDALGNRFVDVAIAEQHAVSFVSGLAVAGKKPIFGVHSSFIQRSYDQLSQDLALNNAPAVVLIFKNGISGANATHLGVFDVALTKSIPNLVCISPSNAEEYLSVLDWAIDQNDKPVIIRVPDGIVEEKPNFEFKTKNYTSAKYEIIKTGKEIAILGLGSYVELAKQVDQKLKSEHGFDSTIINALYSNTLDTETLDQLATTHSIVVTLENGVVDGGFGESVAGYLSKEGIQVLNFGASKEFTDNVSIAELKERYNLTPEKIINQILEIL